jgi:hypothetical protein
VQAKLYTTASALVHSSCDKVHKNVVVGLRRNFSPLLIHGVRQLTIPILWWCPRAQMWLADLGKRRANLEERDVLAPFKVAQGTLLTRRFVVLESFHLRLQLFNKL